MSSDPQSKETQPGARKKPYARPVVRREKIFETQALLCGKINIAQRQCNLLRKTS